MKALRILTICIGLLLGASELARWWNNPRLFPLAFDELVVAAAMLGGASLAGRAGAAPLVMAWGIFTGLMLALLVPTLDHLLFGPEKDGAGFYSVLLALMLLAGIGGLTASLLLARKQAQKPGPT